MIDPNNAAYFERLGTPILEWPDGSGAAFPIAESTSHRLFRLACHAPRIALTSLEDRQPKTEIWNGVYRLKDGESIEIVFTNQSGGAIKVGQILKEVSFGGMIEKLQKLGFDDKALESLDGFISPEWWGSVPQSWFDKLSEGGFLLTGIYGEAARIRYRAGHLALAFALHEGKNQLFVTPLSRREAGRRIAKIQERLIEGKGMMWRGENGRAPASSRASSHTGSFRDVAAWLLPYLEENLSGHAKLALRAEWSPLIKSGPEVLYDADPVQTQKLMS